jgi:Na+/H+-translocating membrane pyrophosphatase
MKCVDLCRLVVAQDPLDPIDLPEFDARNPATVADHVGDIIGDVAGTAADYFGSFTHSIVATLCILASAINTLEMDKTTPVISIPPST